MTDNIASSIAAVAREKGLDGGKARIETHDMLFPIPLARISPVLSRQPGSSTAPKARCPSPAQILPPIDEIFARGCALCRNWVARRAARRQTRHERVSRWQRRSKTPCGRQAVTIGRSRPSCRADRERRRSPPPAIGRSGPATLVHLEFAGVSNRYHATAASVWTAVA